VADGGAGAAAALGGAAVAAAAGGVAAGAGAVVRGAAVLGSWGAVASGVANVGGTGGDDIAGAASGGGRSRGRPALCERVSIQAP